MNGQKTNVGQNAGAGYEPPQGLRPGRLARLAWLPIPLLATAMAALWVADLRVTWSPQPLNLFIHYGPVALGIGFIVIPTARSFLANGQPSVLMLGCGVLIMDIGVIVMPNAFARSSDTAFAIYNTSALLGALCHFAGMVTTSQKVRLRRPAMWLTVVYAGGTAAIGLVIWLAFAGRMPAFFIDGQGGTLLRTLVVAMAVVLFVLTAGLLWQTNRRTASPFLYWYALGLVLLAAGLAGSMLIAVRDSPLQWAARFTQFLGTVYMCVAVLTAVRDSSAEGIPLTAVEEAWREKEFLAGLRRQTSLWWVLRYGSALVAVTMAFGSRLMLETWVGSALPTYITFYPVVMAAALLTGLGPGVLSTALSGLTVAYWILPPTGDFYIASPADRLGLVVFMGMGVFMSVVAELYRRDRDKAAEYDRERALRETRREKEFLANLLEHASQPFAVEYPDGRVGQLNPAFEELTGYSAAELRAIDMSAILTPPEWRELEKHKLDELHGTEQPVRYEKEYLRKDGSRVSVELQVNLMRDTEGKPEYYYSFITDITARKQAEETLAANLAATTRLQQIGARFIKAGQLADVLGEIVDAAIAITHADMGNIQIADPQSGCLRIAAYRGFEQPYLDFWDAVTEGQGNCGTAMRNAQRSIVEDVAQSPIFVGIPSLEVQLDAGVRAIQSTPLIGHSGTLIGMLSTHWHVPHRPAKGDLHLLDLLVQEAVDIIELARAEEALRESEARFHSVLDSSQDVIYRLNVQTGHYEYVSPSAEKVMRYSVDELMAQDVKTGLAMVHPDDLHAVLTTHARVEETGEGEVEYRLRTKSGDYRWLSNHLSLTRGSDGLPLYLSGNLTDITERRRGEEALRESEAKYRNLFENMTEEVHFWKLVRHEDGHIKTWRLVDANPPALKTWGRTLDEIKGKATDDIFGPGATDHYMSVIEKIMAEGVPFSFEDYFPNLDKHFRFTSVPLGDYFITTGADITSIKKAQQILKEAHDKLELRVEERTAALSQAYEALQHEVEEREQLEAQLRQAQKMEALGTLSGGIAHDFNNILAAILGFTELLAGHATKGSRDERHLSRVMEASIRGRELVKQMLTFSRKTEQEKKPLHVSSIVKETVRLIRATTPTTISIRTDVKRESGLILADSTQIQQILLNLCTNAIYAMQEKGGRLDINLTDFTVPPSDGKPHGMKPGHYARLTVRDTGTGMPTDIMDRIFDPFFTTKKVGEGSGLGLSVAHGIVKQHDGYITVESTPGSGSLFTVYFPKITGIPETVVIGDDELPTGSEHILFVDDEEALVEMGEDILAELGYRVTSRTNPREALALFRPDPTRFDLIITDQTMPDITGIELTQEILAIRPDMPIIMCTGFSHVVDADKASEAGIKTFAMKPLRKREIAKTIRKILDERVG